MLCPKCKKDDPQNREMCPDCGYPVKPIPVPPGGKIQFGGYDWFALDKQDGKTLIITEKVIDKRPYHHEETEITWETSDMRKYLNGEFYDSFSEADRARIIEVTNENPDNPWYGTSGGNQTTDRIFLLSIDGGQLSRKIAEQQIEAGILCGYLAFVDGVAIGWCNANDRANFPVEPCTDTHFYAPAEKREKAVVCFEIAPEFRGKGVATALLYMII